MPIIDARPDDDPLKGMDISDMPGESVAVFGAYLLRTQQKPNGDLMMTFGIPFDQIPNAIPLQQFPGGIVFRATFDRVRREELPEGW